MNVHVVVPVRDQLHLTVALVEQMQRDPDWTRAHVFDNGSVDGTGDYLHGLAAVDDAWCVHDAEGARIYEMWEEGLDAAIDEQADRVLFLNNDVALAPGLVGELGAALGGTVWLAYPNYDRPLAEGVAELGTRETRGTYRHGGMSGFCFMALADRLDWRPLVDPALVWWGGDDEIAFGVEERGGRQLRLEGVPVEHVNEGTARHHDLGAQKAADFAYVTAKWGR